MVKLVEALKEEISRLARKEIKVQLKPLKTANTQYRKDISSLKKTVATLKHSLDSQEKKSSKKPTTPVSTEGMRFSARSLKASRTKMGLSRADFALLAGVSVPSLYNWETGKGKPRAEAFAKIVALRGLGKRGAAKLLANLNT